MVMTFGDVDSPLLPARYDIEADRLHCDGRVTESYLKEERGLSYYQPLPADSVDMPSGWCTWARYGRQVTPEEILLNARWLAEHFRRFGTRLVLIDDGWQRDTRDWRGTSERFPQGMRWLSEQLKALQLSPALWICPFGQDNEAVVHRTGHFMLNEDGTSVCGTMGGKFTVDPTKPGALDYVADVCRTVAHEWGFEHLKIDGVQSQVSPTYGFHEAYQRHQQEFAEPTADWRTAFRDTLAAIRRGAGDKVTTSSSILSYDSLGLCETMRVGEDVHNEWYNGFLNAAHATLKGYWLHNIAWVSDPDYCLVAPPLTAEMAQAWVTLLGLTGQFLLFGDRMPDLPASRVAMLKKILPVARVMPADLFPTQRMKSQFCLKVNHLGRRYDLVAAFNYDLHGQSMARVDFGALGLESGRRHFVYDFWHGECLGVVRDGVFLEVAPCGCRLVALVADDGVPVLLSTDRHVLQGWPELQSLATEVDGDLVTIRGVSDLSAGESYRLSFGLPCREGRCFELEDFSVEDEVASETAGHRFWAEVSWLPVRTGPTRWSATFRAVRSTPVPHNQSWPFRLAVEDIDPWTVELQWIAFGSTGGFAIHVDGTSLGTTFSNRCRLTGLPYRGQRKFSISVVDAAGRSNQRTAELSVCVGDALPSVMYLSDLPWVIAESGYRYAMTDRSVSCSMLKVAGRRVRKGIGTHPESHIVYRLRKCFTRLEGACGINDENGASSTLPPEERGSAVFRILGDGRELLPATTVSSGQAAPQFDLDLQGVDRLELLVTRPEADALNRAPHADWLDMRLTLDQ